MEEKRRMKPKIIAVIPARGGSKGIPRKNIKPLHGKPLIAYTIEAALSSKYIDRVITSTEDDEVAEIAREYGAEVVLRPAELASDSAPTEPAVEHVVTYLKETEDYQADIVVLLQPTSPLRSSRHIDEALETFFSKGYDSLLSVHSTPASLWRVAKEGPYNLNFDFRNRARRQDRELQYRENGAIYVTKCDVLMNEHNRLGGKIGLYVIPEEYSWAIDSEFDFWLCEQLVSRRESQK